MLTSFLWVIGIPESAYLHSKGDLHLNGAMQVFLCQDDTMPPPPVTRRSVLALAAASATGALSACTPSPAPTPTRAGGGTTPTTSRPPATPRVTGPVAEHLSTP